MVISTTAANSTRTIGPWMMWNSLPRRTCAFRSTVTAQIHMAGRAWTSISRQFVTSRRSPLKSMTNVKDPFLYPGIALNTSAKDNFPAEQEILDKWAGGATGDFVTFGKLYEKVR